MVVELRILVMITIMLLVVGMMLARVMVVLGTEMMALTSRVPSASSPVRPSVRCLRDLPRHAAFHHKHG